MLHLADGRKSFYQWDLNREIIVQEPTITELHFCNGTSDCSLVCTVNKGRVNVPNILLQTAGSIRVYGYAADYTKISKIFDVHPRTKPEDYVYTETEVKRFDSLEKRIIGLENKKPYTLPTASADTLGGVKVGSGLRMDGDVMEAESEEYEPLTTTWVGEGGTNKIEFPEVTGLSAVMACITMPMSEAITMFLMAINENGETYVVGGWYGSNDGVYSVRLEIYINKGILSGSAQGNIQGWGSSQLLGLNNAGIAVSAESIDSVNIYCPQTDKVIPEGTKVVLYGVRV